MLSEFVEKILVHERARKGSQDTTQEIEIYFNFLGRYIPPSLQPVPLTPEEQEELQKKGERKEMCIRDRSCISTGTWISFFAKKTGNRIVRCRLR